MLFDHIEFLHTRIAISFMFVKNCKVKVLTKDNILLLAAVKGKDSFMMMCVLDFRMVFPVPVNELPFESMLTFHLMGYKKGKNQELLGWAVLPLYRNKYVVYISNILTCKSPQNFCTAVKTR